MPEPVFGEADRVQTPVRAEGDLPAELKGKGPVEIAQYYQIRETRLRDVALKAVEKAKEGTPPVTTTTTTTTNDRPMTGAEVAGARNTLIATAKRESSQGKKYWTRLLPDIERIMAGVGPEQQVDSATWDTA